MNDPHAYAWSAAEILGSEFPGLASEQGIDGVALLVARLLSGRVPEVILDEPAAGRWRLQRPDGGHVRVGCMVARPCREAAAREERVNAALAALDWSVD